MELDVVVQPEGLALPWHLQFRQFIFRKILNWKYTWVFCHRKRCKSFDFPYFRFALSSLILVYIEMYALGSILLLLSELPTISYFLLLNTFFSLWNEAFKYVNFTIIFLELYDWFQSENVWYFIKFVFIYLHKHVEKRSQLNQILRRTAWS